MASMHFIALDIHKKTISYCMKDPHGRVLREGMVAATRQDLHAWMKSPSSTVDRCDGSDYVHELNL